MKTAAGISARRDGLRSAQKLEPEGTAGAPSAPEEALVRSVGLRGFCALALALLPACEALWRPFVLEIGCDPALTSCVDAGKAEPQLLPSNGIEPAWFGEAKAELSPTEDLLINSDLGTVTTVPGNQPLADVSYHQIAPADCGGGWMVGIGVFGFTRIRIPDGVRVRVTGSRAVALVAPGPIVIEGLIDLRGGAAECADPRCGGPGGFAGSFLQVVAPRGDGPGGGAWGYGMGGAGDEAGGGGGGACGSGGKGGDAGSTYLGGSGGLPYQQPTLIPLCGGSGGGAGGPGSSGGDPGQRGGGGGGAIQIVSQTAVSISSTNAMPSGIQAGGGGGQGDQGVNFNDGGGGGGAGGAILIEAPSITIASGAVLAVNGGGGGGGYNGGVLCTAGMPAALASLPAAGGPGQRTGGAGGAGTTLSGADALGPIGDGGAGGGGGVGRIRLNSQDGTIALSGELSPPMGECATTGRLNTR